MPRAIADSDDDEDDLFAETNHVQPAAVIPEQPGRVDADSVNLEQSTGSTEHLRRQIQIAERGLFTNPTSGVMRREIVISSDSPSVRVAKRRNTGEPEAQEGASSQRSVKRTKTTHTYGSRRQSNALTENATFQQLLEEDVVPRTSQSAHFTEHSGLASSAVLPSGNILDDFLNHEPNLMFRDSGSTVADTSSAQQRLLAQRRAEATTSDNRDATNVIANEEQNSSIPFSAMGDHNNTDERSQQKPRLENAVTQDANVVDANTASGIFGAANDTVDPRHLLLPTNEEATRQGGTQCSQVDSGSNIVLSPTVEIPKNEGPNTDLNQEVAKPAKKARLGRIRKANTSEKAEAPVSDDRPVGLPAEQYKPRPSKRRAAPIVEDEIDYSVRPEKAVAAGRRRTGSMVTASGVENADQDTVHGTVNSTGTSTAVPAREAVTDNTPMVVLQDSGIPVEESENKASKDTEEGDPAQHPAERSESSEIVVVPAQSTQKTKTASKSKRSRKVVTEDEAEPDVSPEVLAPSQQQDQKHSALREVKNEAKPAPRKRKNVIVDDDDDDDDDSEDDYNNNEPVKEESKPAQEETAAKKRGRGRPSKATAKVQPEVVEEVTTASGNTDENQPPPEKGAKKAGRGRPAKTSQASKPALKSNDSVDKASSAQEPSNEAPASQVKAQSGSQSTKAKGEVTTSNRSSGELPTSSPEKQNVAKKDAKPKAALHPEKGPSKVTYRVGLSQRARIPPLHRNIKPQKR